MIDSKVQSNEIPHFIVQSNTLCCSKLVIQSVGNEFLNLGTGSTVKIK